jgi:hypothetical protein
LLTLVAPVTVTPPETVRSPMPIFVVSIPEPPAGSV